MKNMIVILMGLSLGVISAASAQTVTFEELSLNPESYYNGSDAAGGFESNNVEFNTFYDDTYGPYWEGFAYSNTTDTTTPDYTNQYSAITGSGANGSSNYSVGYIGFYQVVPTITFPEEVELDAISITNTTYAYMAMQDGAPPAKQFGGASGDDPDWYVLTITGKDATDTETGTVEFYLADFRFADNAHDYIVGQWTALDLSSLGLVKTLEFSVDSSDTGAFGINTPTYFAIDNVEIAQEGDDDDDDDDDNDGGNDIFFTCFVTLMQ